MGKDGGNLAIHDSPLQYSCLEISMDREACQATVPGVAKSWRQLSTHTYNIYVFFQFPPSLEEPFNILLIKKIIPVSVTFIPVVLLYS